MLSLVACVGEEHSAYLRSVIKTLEASLKTFSTFCVAVVTLLFVFYSEASCALEYNLNTVIDGNGSGIVSISPLNQSFNTSTSTKVAVESQVEAVAVPGAFSKFSGWAGDCTGDSRCMLTMSAHRFIQATFIKDMNGSVRVDLPSVAQYSTLYDAYQSSVTGATIQAWGTSFNESLVLNKNIDIKINGGCNASYGACSDVTTVAGKMVVKAGTIKVNRLAIRGHLENQPPIASAGASMSVVAGGDVTLNGSGSSDPDGDQLTYVWSVESIPAASASGLSSRYVVNPSVMIDAPGAYVFSLVVNDGRLSSPIATVTINATQPYLPPIAFAGFDTQAAIADLVTVDGSGSYASSDVPLIYKWEIIAKPGGSTVTLPDTSSVSLNFVPDVTGSYTFGLTVNDGVSDSAVHMVTITVVNALEVHLLIPGSPFDLSPCYLSGSMNVNGFMWTFNGCRVYGNAGNNISAVIINNSNRAFTLNSLIIRYSSFQQNYLINEYSRVLPGKSYTKFTVPLGVGADISEGTATFDTVELGAVTGNFGLILDRW